MEERFARACDYARGLEKGGGGGGGGGGGAGGATLSDAVRLRMYAMYKQSTEGPVGTSKTSRSKPSMLYPVKRAKWNAWAALGNMTRATAMDLYASELFRVSGEHEQKKGNKVNKLNTANAANTTNAVNAVNAVNAANAANDSKRESARGGASGADEETNGETKREHDSGSPRAPTRAERAQSEGGHNEWAPGRVVKVAVKVQMPGKRQRDREGEVPCSVLVCACVICVVFVPYRRVACSGRFHLSHILAPSTLLQVLEEVE